MNVIYNSETTDVEYDSRVVSIEEEENELDLDLPYPCIIMEGIDYVWEINFLKERFYREELSLPVYLKHTGKYFYLTQMELTSQNFAMLNSISNGSYTVTICKSKDNRSVIDYTDGEVLEKFIRLG